MNSLQIEQTVTSLEVAKMLEMRHTEVLRKLEGYIKVLTERKIALSDYFQESTYKDSTGRVLKCYNITKMGCDFLANKFTGEKGIIFTAKYVKRFHEMQEVIQPKSMSAIELISLTQQACLEVNEKVDAVKTDLEDFKLDLPLLGCDMDRITTIVKKIGTECLGGKESNAYKDNVIRARVYADIYDQLKRQFGVTSYKNIRRCECNMAVGIVNEYQLPIVLKNVIDNANNQMSLV